MANKGYFIDDKGRVFIVNNGEFTERQSMMTVNEVISILDNLMGDMVNNVTGDESDGYQDAIQDCVNDVERYIRRIRQEVKKGEHT